MSCEAEQIEPSGLYGADVVPQNVAVDEELAAENLELRRQRVLDALKVLRSSVE